MGVRVPAVFSLVLVIVLGIQVAPVVAKKPASVGRTGATDNRSRAESAYNALQNYFYDGSSHLVQATYPHGFTGERYSFHWPFSQTMAATIDMFGLSERYGSDLIARRTGISAYWDAGASPPGYDSSVRPPFGDGGDKFNDDNAWAALDFERVFRMTGDPSALVQAERLFEFIWSSWSDSPVCSGASGSGGVFWKVQTGTETNHDRNIVSNAPTIKLGLRLYQVTGQRHYLDRAELMYEWVNRTLRDSSDGLYWDHIGVNARGECTTETTKWSYNQGTMIGANALFYEVTGDPVYFERATTIAQSALSHYGCADGCTNDSRIVNHGPAFNAIFFRNLLLLSTFDTTNTAYRRAMQSYADLIWDDAEIRQTMRRETLFFFEPGYVDVLNQAAMVQIYASLAWDAGKLALIA